MPDRIDEINQEFQTKVDIAHTRMLKEVIDIKDNEIKTVSKDVEHHKEIYLNMEVQRDTVRKQKDELEKYTAAEISELKDKIEVLSYKLRLVK